VYHNITFRNPNSTTGLFSCNPVGGGVNVEKLTYYGNGTINGFNHFDTLVFSAGKTYTLTANRTQTVNNRLYASGNPCFLVTLRSSIAGTASALNVLGGSVFNNYANIRDINASGSYQILEFGAQSTNAGNNTNMTFAPPSGEIVG